MAASRRAFLQWLGLNGVLATAAGGVAVRGERAAGSAADPIRLSSNENSYGPGPRVLDVIGRETARVNRYPFGTARQLADALAAHLEVTPDRIVLGCGSSEILDAAVTAFTAAGRALVTAAPTFELPAGRARQLGRPVAEVGVDGALALDLAQMADRSAGAGLVYLCNPNNPTGTVHGSRAIERAVDAVLRRAPDAVILIDEAYHEYVGHPDYRSAIPLALANPQVLVSRTFSKVYGMAGLRVGYAVGRPRTVGSLRPYLNDLSLTHLSGVAAMAALEDGDRVAEQRRLNREAREQTARVFRAAGCRVVDSEANFLMADVGRDIRVFRDACRARGVEIARPFPPLNSWARITIGTSVEMARAADVFRDALAEPVTAAASLLPPLAPVAWDGGVRGC